MKTANWLDTIKTARLPQLKSGAHELEELA